MSSELLAGFVFGVIAVLGPSAGLVLFWIQRAKYHGRLYEAAENLLENPPSEFVNRIEVFDE